MPRSVTTRPGQTSVEFRLDRAPSAGDQEAVITAQLGSDSVQETVDVGAGRRQVTVPAKQFAKYGTTLHFQVSADASATLAAGSLPPGAHFDPSSGNFDWTPQAGQRGVYDIQFTAAGSLTGALEPGHVTVDVDSGAPVVTQVVNAASRSSQSACSSGAIGSLEGEWLAEASADSESSSGPRPGTVVRINGQTAPVLYSSATRLDFLCPDSVPGTELNVIVETSQGSSSPVSTISQVAAPGIFSVDGSGSGQAMVVHAGSQLLAMVRNYDQAAEPAQAGDRLELYATGIGHAARIRVKIGALEIEPDSVDAVPGLPGLYKVAFTVPQGLAPGNSTSLSLAVDLPGGVTTDTNQVGLAIESP
jgi:uncharacterized protein (TIGR03437 family)